MYVTIITGTNTAQTTSVASTSAGSLTAIGSIGLPSPWAALDIGNPGRTGVTAYVKEMYVKIRESRFAEMYSDYDDADGPGPTSEEDAE